MRLGGDGRTEGQWEVGQLEEQFTCAVYSLLPVHLLYKRSIGTKKVGVHENDF